ncbi:MAG: class I SAM-dependent methyltransferase, partial [Acidimicrobiales bacterium]
FREVEMQESTASIRIGADVADALAFIRSMPIVHELLAAAPPAKQAAAVEAVEQALARHAVPEGVVLHGNGAWLVTAGR